MKRILFTLLLLILFNIDVTAQAESTWQRYKLPKDAKLIESKTIPTQVHADRELILWMIAPKENKLEIEPDDIYTCPDETRGDYYSGPTRISLVDTAKGEIINTINISEEEEDNQDSFDVPYNIRKGFYYTVNVKGKIKEGKPMILDFKDYNGDGQALEFALFDKLACMGLATTLIGYSTKQDKVIQYPVELTLISDKKRPKVNYYWVDYLFSQKPIKPGNWKYEIDYRGRGGTLDKYIFRYDKESEKFIGELTSIADEGN